MNAGQERVRRFGPLEDGPRQASDWYLWGPYVSERQWGPVPTFGDVMASVGPAPAPPSTPSTPAPSGTPAPPSTPASSQEDP